MVYLSTGLTINNLYGGVLHRFVCMMQKIESEPFFFLCLSVLLQSPCVIAPQSFFSSDGWRMPNGYWNELQQLFLKNFLGKNSFFLVLCNLFCFLPSAFSPGSGSIWWTSSGRAKSPSSSPHTT